jgi:hypothetical protein
MDLGRVLAHYLHEWHKQTPYAKPTDFVFPSMNRSGRVPICSSVFCADYLRPAAKAAGVLIPDGHRWGLYNLPAGGGAGGAQIAAKFGIESGFRRAFQIAGHVRLIGQLPDDLRAATRTGRSENRIHHTRYRSFV